MLRDYSKDNSLEFLGVICFSVIAGCGEIGMSKHAIVEAFWPQIYWHEVLCHSGQRPQIYWHEVCAFPDSIRH
jgi:hypothetical protein